MKRSPLENFLNYSVRVGKLFDIPINLHITILFFLFPLLSSSGLDALHMLEYALLVIGSILCHELGHALTAKKFGLRGLSIMLHGFGGYAQSSGARSIRQSLLITLAGPAVTLALGLLFFALGKVLSVGSGIASEWAMQVHLISYLGWVNLMLFWLNLLPMLPLDGGNALVSLLSTRRTEFKATRFVAHLGLILGPAIFLYGLFSGNQFVGFFGLIGAMASVQTLLQTGGIRFREHLDDHRAKKEQMEQMRRTKERTDAYLDDVLRREKDREERERLRKLFETSLDEDD